MGSRRRPRPTRLTRTHRLRPRGGAAPHSAAHVCAGAISQQAPGAGTRLAAAFCVSPAALYGRPVTPTVRPAVALHRLRPTPRQLGERPSSPSLIGRSPCRSRQASGARRAAGGAQEAARRRKCLQSKMVRAAGRVGARAAAGDTEAAAPGASPGPRPVAAGDVSRDGHVFPERKRDSDRFRDPSASLLGTPHFRGRAGLSCRRLLRPACRPPGVCAPATQSDALQGGRGRAGRPGAGGSPIPPVLDARTFGSVFYGCASCSPG